MGILLALCAGHMINDTLQALIPSIYPILKQSFGLTFTQIGFITFSFQLTASVLQPVVGQYTDRHPKPFSLATGMGITLVGLALLSRASTYHMILISAVLVGMGSAIFHPEASRVAHMAAGTRKGFAQAVFQTGGNFGSSLGPLLAALIIVRHGQASILWFTGLAFCGIILLTQVGRWYVGHMDRQKKSAQPAAASTLPRGKVIMALAVLVMLMFSKYFYLVSLTNYYTFFLIQKFGVSVQFSQYLLFIFMFAVAAGTIAGGALGDRFGRKYVIWASILGVAPFTLALPHVGLVPTVVLTVFIGFILASAFPAILVFAQELVPGKVGTIAGLFFGVAFGLGGIASATLGKLADMTSISFVFEVCGYLPLIGLLTWFLPDMKARAVAPAVEPATLD
ncbi:MAG TPA: MFS transporter [Opitutaceae bacterium]|jgi:FSR family fosmidomycin resistance protein-like MFS transporter|nr:MFS transporter [Opitutaceae bacterium]